MGIIYRPGELHDIPEAARVYAAAINELNQQHGFGDQLADSVLPNPFYAFSLREEPEGFWVAEADDEIVGMTISWLRGSFWFLACLFISPSHQNQRIGRELLDRALKHGSQGKVTNRALITFAYNGASIALYMRHGINPREPLYRMTGDATAARSIHNETEWLDWDELQSVPDSIRQLCRIDQQALGISLDKHHQYLLNAEGATCYLFRKGDVAEGYAYVWSNGHVGPLAAASSEPFRGMMHTALGLAARQNTNQVSVLIPGCNEQAVETALEHRMRIALPLLLMSSRPFGNWARYLFHSPALM